MTSSIRSGPAIRAHRRVPVPVAGPYGGHAIGRRQQGIRERGTHCGVALRLHDAVDARQADVAFRLFAQCLVDVGDGPFHVQRSNVDAEDIDQCMWRVCLH